MLQLLSAVFLFHACDAMAKQAVCGGYLRLKPDSIDDILNEYEKAYKKAGFTITRKEKLNDHAEFHATLIVPSSRFQQEVREVFYYGPPDYQNIIYQGCGALAMIRQPEQYDAAERNDYLSKFEDSFKEPAKYLNETFPKNYNRQ